jgi:hypothetical protein
MNSDELIEKLGEDFMQIIRFGDGFKASNPANEVTRGKTMNEALERLLLLKQNTIHTPPPLSPPPAFLV